MESSEPQRPEWVDSCEHERRERAYRQQQKELLERIKQQRQDLLKSMEQRRKMEADFTRRSVRIWEEYFKRLIGYHTNDGGQKPEGE